MESRLPRYAPQRRSPSRPSFRAPTKASLARSHPEILERALSRSPTRIPTRDSRDGPDEAETRGFGLRDRKALRPSLTASASPADPSKRGQQPPLSASRRSSALGAFAAPPRRVSKRISASDLLFRSPIASQETISEASIINTPEEQLASELGSANDMGGDIDGPSLHDGFEEPDLPPTPTQLGLERAPDRPRGLLSSSPSMQWKKRQATGDLERSPSKLRPIEFGVEPEVSTEVVSASDTILPQSVFKKRKLRRDLSAEVESLKQDITKLEGLCNKLEHHGENIEPYLSDLSSLLIPTDASYANTNSQSTNQTISSIISRLLPFSTKRPPKPRHQSREFTPFALEHNVQSDLYLSALAPLKITSSSNIVSTSRPDSIIEKHQLTLAAPRPFPSNVYKLNVSYETDPETQSLTVLSASLDGSTSAYLQRWADQRLANPLLKLDVSGLCWGLNRYWDALVSRAQLWAQIEEQHPSLIHGYKEPKYSEKRTMQNSSTAVITQFLTISDMRRVLPHLERTCMLFELEQRALQTLLSCELTLDEWTGEPELTPTICVSSLGSESSSNEKVDREAKKLFQAILSENTDDQPGSTDGSDAQAIVKATNCVLDMLFRMNKGEAAGGKL
ncbi:hypothetical protein BJY04DRAFT_230784 [Aspergillus karnatakaensis]|uniref:uncharacterized protein n=1 Tax=Aspergillus karnatakaensis TaxID=1810916 RepID=UPI003CCE0AB7